VALVAVGLAWALTRRGAGRDIVADVVGALALVVGAVAVAVARRASVPGFEATLAQLGHALAPWSAFAPFALGIVAGAPPNDREARARVALLAGTLVACFAQAWLETSSPAVVFVGPSLVAGMCAVAMRDLERARATERDGTRRLAIGLGTAALAVVLLRDARSLPDTTLQAYGVAGAKLPESFKHASEVGWTLALAIFALAASFAAAARETGVLFDVRRYLGDARSAARAWGGGALLVYLGVAGGSIVAQVALFVGLRAHAKWAMGTSALVRQLVSGTMWASLVLPLVIVLVVPLLLDAASFALRRIRGQRGAFFAAGATLAGGMLVAWQYPALAAQLSPRGALDTFIRVQKPGDELALVGVREVGPSYAARVAARFDDPHAALDWLETPAAGHRRFAVVGDGQLAALNHEHRERTPAPHANLPVLDARSSATLLVASSLEPGESSANPFDAITLSAAPTPQHPLHVDLSGELDVLGYDVVDGSGARTDSVVPGKTYRMRTYYVVHKRPTTAWQSFIHIDGQGRRHNGDHALMDGKYPPTSWVVGDILVDDAALTLPPSFTPGAYRVYFGLYAGETRLKVTSGPSDGSDRIDGGDLHVR
jgi:hypothetical protein